MNKPKKLTLALSALLLTLALTAGPVLAVEEDVPAETTTTQEDDGGRIALADSPRDRVGLILLGSMFAAAAIGFAGMRRQLKGEHSQATGEFRWR